MSRNKTSQGLNVRFEKTIASMQTELLALKAKQIVGADNLVMETTGQHSFARTLAAGEVHFFVVSLHTTNLGLYQSTMRLGAYIGTDADPDYVWPIGSLLSGTTLDPTLYFHTVTEDTLISNEVIDGTRAYVLRLENTGSTSKTIYFYYEFVYPKQFLST
jgi:hypothetical protein